MSTEVTGVRITPFFLSPLIHALTVSRTSLRHHSGVYWKTTVRERRANTFIPHEVKTIFKVLEDIGDLNAGMILDEFTSFYDRWLSYIELWEYSFGGTETFALVNNNAIAWREIETSAVKISERLGYAILDVVELLHEVVISKAF